MPKVDRKNYLTSDLQVKTPSTNRRHPDSVPRFSIPLRKAYNGQAPHTVARQLRIFTVFPARSPIDFCSFYLIVFILIRMIIIRSRKNSYSLYLFQSICLLLHRRKAPAKQGIVPIYVSQELFCPVLFLAGSSNEAVVAVLIDFHSRAIVCAAAIVLASYTRPGELYFRGDVAHLAAEGADPHRGRP